MRVAMYYRNDDIRIEEMDVPEISDDEILVRVQASGICGTDVMEWYRAKRAPLVLGHEIAGDIVKIGNNVVDYDKGDRIVAAHHVPCSGCEYCERGQYTVCDTLRTTNFDPGGFAEFVRLPSINVEKGIFRLPDEMSYEEGTFVEPLACVLRGQNVAQLKKGQSILVIGCGISGLLHIKLARSKGAKKIFATDINEHRLKVAKRAGADHVVSANKQVSTIVKDLNGGNSIDMVILCTGAMTAIEQGLKTIERAGTVLFFAPTRKDEDKVPVSINELFWRNEVNLVSSYAGSPQDHDEALELIKNKNVSVDDLITHRLGLADTQKGFKLVADADKSLKVIIEPQK